MKKDVLPIAGSFKWSDQNRDTFIDSLLDPKGMSEILSLNYLLDDKFNDIELLIEKNKWYFHASCKKLLTFKPNIPKYHLAKRKKKAIPKKE